VPTIEIEGRSLRLTNLDKLMWPDVGITKGDLLRYHALMAEVILPHWRGRPMTVTRYPDGVGGEYFYQKNCPLAAPPWVERCTHEGVNYVLVNDTSTLLWLVNQGAVEFHPAEFTISGRSAPSWAVIDLDPTPPCGFEAAVEVALLCRQILLELGLRGYPKTSGAAGIHIYIPLAPAYDFTVSLSLAKAVGFMLQRKAPQLVTLERLVRRRSGVYVDYLQHGPSRTMVGVYSPRPTAAATVSTPVTWDELPEAHPSDFTVRTVPARVRGLGDLFAPVLWDHQTLEHILPVLQRV